MPRIGFSKEQIAGEKPVDPGKYQVQLVGFKPTLSNDKQSVNLNPDLRVINNANAAFNGKRIFHNLSEKAGWLHKEMCDGFGIDMVAEGGQFFLPGTFQEDPSNPTDCTKWRYQGPLLGKVASVEVVEIAGTGQNANKKYINIKEFYPAPGFPKVI
jgi:hypothetical protein